MAEGGKMLKITCQAQSNLYDVTECGTCFLQGQLLLIIIVNVESEGTREYFEELWLEIPVFLGEGRRSAS